VVAGGVDLKREHDRFIRLVGALDTTLRREIPDWPKPVRDNERKYFCWSWRLGQRGKRELFVEYPGLPDRRVLRIGLYFYDSPKLARSSSAVARLWRPVVAVRTRLAALGISLTFSTHSYDEKQAELTPRHLTKWLRTSGSKDLVRIFDLSSVPWPEPGVAAEILRALQPIWREWNATRPPPHRGEFDEGARREVSRELAQRNDAFRSAVRRERGLDCEICGFSFGRAYGTWGAGFIEVHHLKPLSDFGRRRSTTEEARCVCSNCHRMLHRGSRMLSVEELRSRLTKAAGRTGTRTRKRYSRSK
jgi:hypothetical protein